MTKGNRLITAKFTAFKNLGREWLIRPVPIIAPESSPWSSPRCSPLQDSIRQMDLVGGSHRAWKMPNVSMIYTPHHLSTLLDKAGSVQCSPSRKCYRARAPSTFLSLADKNDNAWNFRHRAMNGLERRWRWQKIRKTNCLWSAFTMRNPDFSGVTFWTSICFAQCSKACIQLSDPFSDLAFFLHSLRISLFLIRLLAGLIYFAVVKLATKEGEVLASIGKLVRE